MKATHRGTCQICGATQKLPGSRLSKHGYTTKWGFFSGTCTGAESLPFELDKSLIAAKVDSVRKQITELEFDLVELETTTQYAWVQERIAGDRYQNRRWRQIQRAELSTQQDGFQLVWTGLDNKEHRMGTYARGLDGAMAKANEGRAWHQRGVLKSMRDYVEWQTRRLADWAPHPEQLIPVEA